MRNFFGLDDAYVRPVPEAPWGRDILVAAVLMLLALTGVVGMAGLEGFAGEGRLAWSIPVCLLAGVLIVFRRRWPVATLLTTTGAHFFIVGVTLPIVSLQTGMQVLYFLGLYSAMAWARNREALMLAVLAVVLLMAGWVGYDVATGTAAHRLQYGSVPTMFVANQVLVNVAYFGGAMWLGRNAWLRARSDAALEESRALVAEQSRQLADQAIVSERLRIARELHDSVAHHVSLIGVQAAAARRSMEKKPDAAARALLAVEGSARQTVEDLRTLLGSLRDAGDVGSGEAVGLQALPTLLADVGTLGLRVHHEVVGDPASIDQLSVAQSGTLFRVVQEALTNVRTHSTATQARVTVRLTPTHAEAEVVDDGRPRVGTSGGGMGHLGIRERVAALGGTCEVGPRHDRGYRVLVRLPLRSEEPT